MDINGDISLPAILLGLKEETIEVILEGRAYPFLIEVFSVLKTAEFFNSLPEGYRKILEGEFSRNNPYFMKEISILSVAKAKEQDRLFSAFNYVINLLKEGYYPELVARNFRLSLEDLLGGDETVKLLGRDQLNIILKAAMTM